MAFRSCAGRLGWARSQPSQVAAGPRQTSSTAGSTWMPRVCTAGCARVPAQSTTASLSCCILRMRMSRAVSTMCWQGSAPVPSTVKMKWSCARRRQPSAAPGLGCTQHAAAGRCDRQQPAPAICQRHQHTEMRAATQGLRGTCLLLAGDDAVGLAKVLQLLVQRPVKGPRPDILHQYLHTSAAAASASCLQALPRGALVDTQQTLRSAVA